MAEMPTHREGAANSLIRRSVSAAGYLLLHLPLPLAAAFVVLTPVIALGDAGIALAVLLAVVVSVLMVASAPIEREIVRQLNQLPIPDQNPEGGRSRSSTVRAAAYGFLSSVLAPFQAVLLLGWMLCSLALIASPALIGGGEGPIAIGPVSVESSTEAWIGLVAGLVLLPLGLATMIVIAEGQAALARALLGPRGGELRSQVTELSRSRIRLVDAFDVERRRIERDLHDGAQQHLTALAMKLDLARVELDDGNTTEAKMLIDDAHGQVSRTITELRDLIQGIHPPVLTNLGLPAAAVELADRSPLEVTIEIDLPTRLDPSVESAGYFVIAEALTNAEKHSGGERVVVSGDSDGSILELVISDDGHGGADAAAGSGLAGLGDRVSALGGSLKLHSPAGGPTVLRAIIPLL